MWFADKLGPVPKASPLGKAQPQSTKNIAPKRGAAPAQQVRSRSGPTPAPEQPKKKGWF